MRAICIFAGIALRELIGRVLVCLAEGLGMRATAPVFAVKPNTVVQWLVEAADQFRVFSHYCLCEVHVRQVQLYEWYQASATPSTSSARTWRSGRVCSASSARPSASRHRRRCTISVLAGLFVNRHAFGRMVSI